MSTISNKQPEFDYWEFVHCAVCFLPFSVDDKDSDSHPPTVPFWLTECGHTVCNSHLKSDQSCAACAAPNIQLIPLQRELSPPMNEWFRPLCRTLDAVSATVRFQQDTMAALVRFYKGKCMQQRATINRAREVAIENKALRSQIEQLQQENIRLRQATGTNNNPGQRFASHNRPQSFNGSASFESGELRNVNGKRPMAPPQGFSSSPPRIVTTPIPPSRLTLPQNHPQPESRHDRPDDIDQNRDSLHLPSSSRFGQFAYQPPQTPQPPSALHQQQFNFRPQMSATPYPRDDANDVNNSRHEPRRQQQQQRSMPPPPTPTHRHPPLSVNDPSRTTRGQFRPASTSVLNRTANTESDRFQAGLGSLPNPTVPMTPSTNRFFAPKPQVADLSRNAHTNLASGSRTPFILPR